MSKINVVSEIFMKKAVIIVSLFLISAVLFLAFQTEKDSREFVKVMDKSFQKPVNSWQMFDGPSPLIFRADANGFHRENIDGAMAEMAAGNLPNPLFSPNGKYVASIASDANPTREDQENEWQLRIFDDQFELISQIKLPRYLDENAPAMAISNRDGSVITGRPATGELRFLSPNGEIRREVTLFADADFDLERSLILRISADGQKIAVLASKRGAAPADSNAPNPDGEPHLIIFSANGDELSRTRLPGFAANQLRINPGGDQFLVNGYTVHQTSGVIERYASLYNENGEVVWQSDILFKHAAFSENGANLILSDNQRVLTVDISANAQLWQAEFAPENGMISAVSIANSGDAAVLVAKNEFRDGVFLFEQPQLQIRNRNGEALQQFDFTQHSFEHPGLALSPNGDVLKIGFRHSFQMYRKTL